jgi:hypothetical protein
MPVCNICPLGTVCVHDASVKVSATSNEPKDQAVLRGEPFRKYAVEAILLDLIAESRLWLSGDNPVPLGLVLDRAETRLLDTGD